MAIFFRLITWLAFANIAILHIPGACALAQNLRLVDTGLRLPTAAAFASALFDGEDCIYILGGFGSPYYADEVLQYSLASGTLITIGRFYPMAHGVAVYHEKDVFYFGGDEATNSAVWRFSTIHGNYSLFTRLPTRLHSMSLAWDAQQGVGYILNGATPSGDSTPRQVLRFSAASHFETYEDIGRTPAPRRQLAGGVWDSRRGVAWTFGGTEIGGSSGGTRDVLRYDPVQNVARVNASLAEPMVYSCAVYSETDDFIYVHGDGKLVRFDPVSEESESLFVDGWVENLGSSACVHAYGAGLNRMYIIGGRSGDRIYRDEIWYIDLSGSGTEPPTVPSTTDAAPSTAEATTTNAITTARPPPEDCADGETRLIPDPFCCYGFYFCEDGTATKFECVRWQQFNPATLRCEDTALVQCGLSYGGA